MSIAHYITATDVANEIRLLRQNHSKILFVVEGKTDSKVLRIAFNVPIECLVISHGKDNVREVCASLPDQGCIFMIDKDFGEKEPAEENLLETDLHSIESYLISSRSIRAVTIQKFDRLTTDAEITGALEEVTQISSTLSLWKWALNGMGFGTVDESTVPRLVSKSGEYEGGSLETRVRQLNHNIKVEHTDEVKRAIASCPWAENSHENICPKIWIATFARLSQQKFGTQRGNTATFEHVFDLVICCTNRECFDGSDWFRHLKSLYDRLLPLRWESASTVLDAA